MSLLDRGHHQSGGITVALAVSGSSSRRSSVSVVVLASLALALAGCGSSGKKADAIPAPASSSTQSATATDAAEAQARTAVLAAYRGMWTEEVKAYASGSLQGVNLEPYAGDKALADIKSTAVYYQDHNMVLRGEPSLSPQITALDLSSTPNRATVRDCVDSSNFLPMDKTTGQPVKLADGTHRHLYTSSARVYAGRWVVMDSAIDREQPC